MSFVQGNVIEFWNLFNAARLPSQCRVGFTLLTSPLLVDDSIVHFGAKHVPTNPAGKFGIWLLAGDYQVDIDGQKMFIIHVLNDDDTYDIKQLITPAIVYIPELPPGSAQPHATPTVFGVVETISFATNPKVPLDKDAVLRSGMRSNIASLPGAGAVVIDFNAPALTIIDVAGAVQISTTNRQDDPTVAKHATALLRNVGGPAVIDFGDIKFLKPIPPDTLGVNVWWLIGLTSLGAAETFTLAAWKTT